MTQVTASGAGGADTMLPCSTAAGSAIEDVLNDLARRLGHETEFLQAAEEILRTVGPVLDRHPEFLRARILERLVEPERVVMFRVPWIDDTGRYRVHRGYRVQFSSAIGPYKGGIRFHPTVTLSVLKFLGFEQIFKNALTTLPMGGGKGGSDFDPKGRSDDEVMRFCQSFMTELFRHIGADRDVPAGDIGVGTREIGYLFGQYRRLTGTFNGVFTGKGLSWGGSRIRPEATGYGVVYFAQNMLERTGRHLAGMRCLISGSGNVAQYTCHRLLDQGAVPITLSDSGGFIHDPDGIDPEKLAFVMDLKNRRRGRISEYVTKYPRATFTASEGTGSGPGQWQVPADAAFPCATQHEIDRAGARALVAGGVQLVVEGANMPCTLEAAHDLIAQGVLFAPGKAANAGGVATSGLEMSQNAQWTSWTAEEVDRRLREIMRRVHDQAWDAAEAFGAPGNYLAGANIAGFTKVAQAMLEQGLT